MASSLLAQPFVAPIIFLTGVLIGVSVTYLIDVLSSRGVIRSDVLELYEGDIDKMVLKEVDDYGRLSVGTDLAGRKVRVWVTDMGEPDEDA